MDIRTSLLSPLLVTEGGQKQAIPAQKQAQKPESSDFIRLSKKIAAKEQDSQNAGNAPAKQNQTRLISEKTEDIENGFRRIQKFEGKDGRNFTRVEEFTATPDRAKRIVVQQNRSGNTTVAENILDRQPDGTFRLTQRFTDEVGATNTNIEFNVVPENIDVILGRTPTPEQQNENPFRQSRGTQFDVRA